ncbi:MAG: hypothetical protein Q7U20_10775 [Caulobacter sp.]|nr:hypothetical protein [Caulobacter sp.]
MLILRIIAVIQALSLIIGETWRSWGAGRHWLFVVDDYWISALLLLGAWAMKTDGIRSRALFAAGWGANAGMLYGSFFGKLIEPASSNPGNFDIGVLTWLIGLAWAVSVIGVIASVMLPGGHVPEVRVP